MIKKSWSEEKKNKAALLTHYFTQNENSEEKQLL